MKAGEEQIRAQSAAVLLIDPAAAVQAVSSLHAILGRLETPIHVCDPYLDGVTLEHLGACSKSSTVELLTQTVRDDMRVRRLLSALGTQGVSVSVRVAHGGLHDRYVIDAQRMSILGSSLNGFGKKQCFVIEVGQDIRAITLTAFQHLWVAATPWI